MCLEINDRNYAGSAMLVDGKRQRVRYETLDINPDDFGEIGEAFDKAHGVDVPQIGNAEVRFFKQRAVVDFAVEWMEKYRGSNFLTQWPI